MPKPRTYFTIALIKAHGAKRWPKRREVAPRVACHGSPAAFRVSDQHRSALTRDLQQSPWCTVFRNCRDGRHPRSAAWDAQPSPPPPCEMGMQEKRAKHRAGGRVVASAFWRAAGGSRAGATYLRLRSLSAHVCFCCRATFLPMCLHFSLHWSCAPWSWCASGSGRRVS